MFNDLRGRCAVEELLTSSPASFFTTCWADNTLVAAMAEARLCRQKRQQTLERTTLQIPAQVPQKILKVL